MVRVVRTGPSTRLGRIGASLAAIEDEPTLLQKTTGALIAKLGHPRARVLRHRCVGVRRAAGRLDRRRVVRDHAGHRAPAGRISDGAGDLPGARGLSSRPAQGPGAPRRRDRDARRRDLPMRRQDRDPDREPDGPHHGLAGRRGAGSAGPRQAFRALPSSRCGRHCSPPPSARSIPWTGPSACIGTRVSRPNRDGAATPLRHLSAPARPAGIHPGLAGPGGRRAVCRERARRRRFSVSAAWAMHERAAMDAVVAGLAGRGLRVLGVASARDDRDRDGSRDLAFRFEG